MQNQILFQRINLIKICNIHFIKYYKYEEKENSLRGSIVRFIQFAMKIAVYASMTCVLRIILRLLTLKIVSQNGNYRFHSEGMEVYSFWEALFFEARELIALRTVFDFRWKIRK